MPDTTVDLEKLGMEAFEKGLAGAVAAPRPDSGPIDDGVPDDFVEGSAPPAGDPPADETPADDPPPGDKPADEAGDPPAPDETEGLDTTALEKEMDSLDLKGKTRERFMAREKKLHDLSTELTSYKSREETIKQAEERFSSALQFHEMVQNIGAQPEQIGMALGYVAAMVSGDPERMRAGLKLMRQELEIRARQLGEDVPGVDPFADHPDLAQKITDHDISREDALEIVRLRNQTRQVTERTQATATAAAADQEQQKALTDIAAWAKGEMAKDAALYNARKPLVEAYAQTIMGSVPPAQWPKMIADFVGRMPKPTRQAPARPQATPSTSVVRTPKDDMEAFDIGLAKAKTLGY